MTDSNLHTPEEQEMTDHLDQKTEHILGTVAACYSAVGYASSSPVSKKRAIDDAGDAMVALRSRIRELVEEARSNAVVDFLKDKNFTIGNPDPDIIPWGNSNDR